MAAASVDLPDPFESTPPPPPDGRRTILATDDCVVTQTILKSILGQDYRVILAGSALEALAIAAREPVDLFLVDLTMPEVDGLELCRTVRRIPRFANAPVVILTGRDRPFDKVQGKIAGATAYLLKPINSRELREAIAAVLPD